MHLLSLIWLRSTIAISEKLGWALLLIRKNLRSGPGALLSLLYDCSSRWNLLIVHDSPSLDRILIVLTIVALANGRAQDAGLKALTVLLQTCWFLAGAAFSMLLVNLLRIVEIWLPKHLIPSDCILCDHLLGSLRCRSLLITRCLLIRIAAYLWPEGVRWLVQSLLHRVLANTFEEWVVLTRITVASVGCTVEARSKAFTVKLEAAWITAIAGFTGHWSRWR